MLPVLLHVGPLTIYSFGVCLFFGLLFGLYTWWKLGRDEHWDEIALFDSFFLSLFIFFVFARLSYVFMHWTDLHFWYRALSLIAYPGLTYSAGIVGSLLFLVLFARLRGWEIRKVWDSAVVALSVILIFTAVGACLGGSSVGIPWRWGIVASDMVRRLPADLWTAVWAPVTYVMVSRVRKNFRFYLWYRRDATVARDGLATLLFAAMVGLFYLVRGFLVVTGWHVWRVPGMALVGFCLLGASLGAIILQRGEEHGGGGGQPFGRLLQWVNKKKRRV